MMDKDKAETKSPDNEKISALKLMKSDIASQLKKVYDLSQASSWGGGGNSLLSQTISIEGEDFSYKPQEVERFKIVKSDFKNFLQGNEEYLEALKLRVKDSQTQIKKPGPEFFKFGTKKLENSEEILLENYNSLIKEISKSLIELEGAVKSAFPGSLNSSGQCSPGMKL